MYNKPIATNNKTPDQNKLTAPIYSGPCYITLLYFYLNIFSDRIVAKFLGL